MSSVGSREFQASMEYLRPYLKKERKRKSQLISKNDNCQYLEGTQKFFGGKVECGVTHPVKSELRR